MTREGRCIRFSRVLTARLAGLLHMQYRIHEIAEELGVEPRQIRRYLSYGAPCQTDDEGHVWVVGSDFRDWVTDTRESRKSALEPEEAYCLRCNTPTKMIGPFSTVRVRKTRFEVRIGRCGICGTKVTRGRARAKKRD